jgi:endonuclease YncB( thermonuclease family)
MTMRSLALALLILAGPALAESFSGRVVSIHDGDTLTVLAEHKQITVHLAEVDAPELRQAFGAQARQSLADLCFDKPARVLVVGHDRQGGAVGRIHCDGVDASAKQVQRGMAWVYQRQANSASQLYFLEDQAQRNREGLWADPTSMPPWAHRANRRNRR